MKKKKKLKITLFIILILGIATYIGISRYKLYKIVVENRNDWDIFLTMNTPINGEYMGKIYEKDYKVTNIPGDILSILFTDYYISHEESQFDSSDKIEENIYQKRLNKEKVLEISNKLFGPDYDIPLKDIEYGCGRSLKKDKNDYIITYQDPDACGVYSYDLDVYLTNISNYYKKKDLIYINMKVAYIDAINYFEKDLTGEENDEIKYVAYTNKDKKNIISGNYDPKCIYNDGGKDCYKDFSNYTITLKKASDNKYYFNDIKRS